MTRPARGPAIVAMLAAVGVTVGAAAQTAGPEAQVMTFAITVLPPPPALAAPRDGTTPSARWLVSETRSPVDYGPVAIATVVAGADDEPRLSIQCRGGQTEVLVLLPAPPTGREAISVGLDDEPPRPLRATASPSQDGVVLRDPPRTFLAALPERGTLRLRVAVAGRPDLESRIALPTLSAVLRRLAPPCGWTARPAATP